MAILFDWDMARNRSKCRLCGRVMWSDDAEKKHLRKVHGFSDLEALLLALEYYQHQLDMVNEEMASRFVVAIPVAGGEP